MKETETHYADTRYCVKIDKIINISQMKSTGILVVKCVFNNAFECFYDKFHPSYCPLKLEKLVVNE